MRYKELLETPVEALDTIGDFSKSYNYKDNYDEVSWKEKDINFLKQIFKRKEIWKNNPFLFNQIFIQIPKRPWPLEYGYKDNIYSIVDMIFSEKENKEFLNNDKDSIYNLLNKIHNKETITILHAGNEADKRIAMTSWNMAHRTAHSFTSYDKIMNIYQNNMLRKMIVSLIEIIDIIFYNERNDINNYIKIISEYEDDTNHDELYDSIESFFTFSSARNHKTRDVHELLLECISQYIVKGHITIDKNLNSYINKTSIKFDKIYKDEKWFEKEVSNIEKSLNNTVYEILSKAKGKLFLM